MPPQQNISSGGINRRPQTTPSPSTNIHCPPSPPLPPPPPIMMDTSMRHSSLHSLHHHPVHHPHPHHSHHLHHEDSSLRDGRMSNSPEIFVARGLESPDPITDPVTRVSSHSLHSHHSRHSMTTSSSAAAAGVGTHGAPSASSLHRHSSHSRDVRTKLLFFLFVVYCPETRGILLHDWNQKRECPAQQK